MASDGIGAGRPDALRFLHRVDFRRRQIEFVRTDLGRLRAAIFLDGREKFWDGETETAAFPQFSGGEPAVGGDRMIFHMAFGGSTLLARLLDRCAAAIVLKEPQCLVDLADWRRCLGQDETADCAFAAILGQTRQALRLGDRGPVVVKLSSWANSLLPLLAGPTMPVRPLFLTMGRREYVRAVVRGGRDRLAFSARAANHLAAGFANGQALVGEAIAAGADALSKAINLAALVHVLQQDLFEAAAGPNGLANAAIDFSEISADPAKATARAARILGLVADPAAIDEAVTALGKHHAKMPGEGYSAAKKSAADRAVDNVYSRMIDQAVELSRQWSISHAWSV